MSGPKLYVCLLTCRSLHACFYLSYGIVKTPIRHFFWQRTCRDLYLLQDLRKTGGNLRRTEVHRSFEAPMATGDGPWWKCRGALWTDVSGIGIEQPCQGQPRRTPGSLGASTIYCHSSRERPKNISPKDRPSFRTTVEQAASHRRAMARALLTQAAPLVADATKQGLADLSHAPQTRKFWSGQPGSFFCAWIEWLWWINMSIWHHDFRMLL